MRELNTIEEWKDVLEQSKKEPVLLIKHSNTCPISAAGYQEFKALETELPKYYVIVQTSKDISRQIAEDTGVKHESPQVLLVKDGKVAWHASHYDIQRSNLENAIKITN